MTDRRNVQSEAGVLLRCAHVAFWTVTCCLTLTLGLGQPGSIDKAFNFVLSNGRVETMLPLSDGRILLGGIIRGAAGCYGLFVPLHEDGNVDWSFLQKSAPDGGRYCSGVRAIALQPDGKILIGGSFTFYSGLRRLGVARVNPDGSPDETFMPEFEAPVDTLNGSAPYVASIGFQSDGKIIVGGQFTRVNGHARTNMARLFPDGRLDFTFISDFVPSRFVNRVIVQVDDKILILGDLTLRRLNPDGSLDENFDRLRPAGILYELVLQPDGKILLGSGGDVPWLPGSPSALIVRLNPDGSVDRTFFPILKHGESREWIADISLLQDGQIFVGGEFMAIQGALPARLARLHSNGTVDGNFTAELPVDPFIMQETIQVDRNGNVLVATAEGINPSSAPPPLVRVLGGEPAPAAPEFKFQPVQSTFGWGEAVLLTTVIAGSPKPACQWRVDGQDLPGATNSALLMTNLSTARPGAYRMYLSNALGTALSDPVKLTVPSIAVQPASLSVPLLAPATFSVDAESPLPVVYQWQKDSNDVAGATNSTLTIKGAQAADAGNYRVVARNAMGSTTTAPAALSVLAPQPPEIVFRPQSQTIREGEGVSFSARIKHYLPVAYQWEFQGQALPGATNAILELSEVDRSMAGAYRVIIDSQSGSAISEPATLTVIPATVPIILTQPKSQVVDEGGVVLFSVAATNYLGLSYRWQQNGVDIPGGGSSTLTLANVHLSDAGVYRVVVRSEYESIASDNAVLTVTPLPFTERAVRDPSQTSLEEAILSSRTVTFGFDGVIAFTNTIRITRDVTIDATGRRITFDGQKLVRHFNVTHTATLRLINLTLVNGRFVGQDGGEGESGSPGYGGSIHVGSGHLVLERCQFLDNSVSGGNGGAATLSGIPMTDGASGYGGAVSVFGSLRATDCLFANNSATGGHGQSFDIYTAAGEDAFGGAIYNGPSEATLTRVTFTNNSAVAGPLWGSRPARGGGQSWGGGLANQGGKTVVKICAFLGNHAVGSTKVADDPSETGNANGGAIAQLGGSTIIEETLFRTNTAVGGHGASRGASAAVSAPGNGGAIYNGSGIVDIRRSALVFNRAEGGPVTYSPPWGATGGSGSGGAIYNAEEMSVVNCTLAENSANGGNGIMGFGVTAGGAAFGGGLFLERGSASLVNVTIVGNSVQAGTFGTVEALGASIATIGGQNSLTNSILACLSTQTNVIGSIIDGGHNLCSDRSASFTSGSSRENTDPMLGPLADNGGSTPTILLLPKSPAIDAGDSSQCPGVDQRGVLRPQGRGCDIGALELSPKLALSREDDGTLWLECTFLPSQRNKVSVSSNLFQWLPIEDCVSDETGYFRIADPEPQILPARFYRVQPVE